MSGRFAAVEDWAIGIDRRTGSLIGIGIGLSVLLIAGIALVFSLFSGVFTAYDEISVRLPGTSTAALPGSSVQYRDVSIGKVIGQGRQDGDGTTVVTVHLRPGTIKTIPASVRGTVNPISIFGNQYVVLQAPADAGSAVLRPGSTVQELAPSPTSSVQQTVASLDRLLNAVHPAALNSALTAVAQALQDQGKTLGETADLSSAYLAALQPLFPTIIQDLGLLAPFANQVAASSPDIIGLLGNQLTTAQTITDDAAGLDGLLRGSTAAIGQTAALSTDIRAPFSLVTAASGPFLDAISAHPNTIGQLLEGLDAFATSVLQAGRAGPFLSVSVNVDVRNPADLALAALGGPDILRSLAAGLAPGQVDPATYTAADRPTFPAGPAGAAAARTAPVGTTGQAAALTGVGDRVVPVLPADAERSAVSAVAAALGGVPPRSADVAALLLSPLLKNLGQR